MRFIRKNGRVIPIRERVASVVKGAAHDAGETYVTTTVLNRALLKSSWGASSKIGAQWGLAIGGLSAGIRAGLQTYKALKARRKNALHS